MDSGNSSGSLQSSSGGGGDEGSSSFSAFLNNVPPPPTPTPTLFDPLSNYLDPTQRSLLNLDMMWSKPPDRSEPNRTHLAHFLPCSSSSISPSFLSAHQLPASETRGSTTCSAFLNTHHNSLLPPESGSRGLLSVSAATNNDQAHNNNVVRNPKKRSRASRRAPTTVLTTDTTNFRAMVQEFTGIPAPPFTSSSPFSRTRFDLFAPLHAATTIASTSTLLNPPYLLRPFPQKLQLQQQQHHLHPFPPSNSTNSTTNSTSINYHLSSSDDHPLNFNNPSLTFLQQSPNYPLANSSSSSVLVASKTQQQQQQPSLEIPPPMGVLEELGFRHAHVNNTNVVSSNLHHQNINMVSSSGNNNNFISTNIASSMEWAQRTGTVTNNGKVQYSSASKSSDFHGEKKGSECTTTTTVAAARSQGMVESWINCSSHN